MNMFTFAFRPGLAAAAFLACAALFAAVTPSSAQSGKADKAEKAAEEGVYAFTMKNIDGKMVPLSKYKGKVLLIVNTASKCGYTPEYASLEKLYETYKGDGFEILGFPANNFKNQEPGTDKQIKNFCTQNYGVKFDMFSKTSVKGKDINPLYAFLTKESAFPGAITWNFNKFLIDKTGHVVARFDTPTDPMSHTVITKVKEYLEQD